MSQPADKERARSKLWILTYSDPNAGVLLKTYADTLVFDHDGYRKILVAVRFSGYAEQVRGMADAIFGGGTVKAELEGEAAELSCMAQPKSMV